MSVMKIAAPNRYVHSPYTATCIASYETVDLLLAHNTPAVTVTAPTIRSSGASSEGDDRSRSSKSGQTTSAARMKKNVCRHYVEGNCNRGSSCRFYHPGSKHRVITSSSSAKCRAKPISPLADLRAQAEAELQQQERHHFLSAHASHESAAPSYYVSSSTNKASEFFNGPNRDDAFLREVTTVSCDIAMPPAAISPNNNRYILRQPSICYSTSTTERTGSSNTSMCSPMMSSMTYTPEQNHSGPGMRGIHSAAPCMTHNITIGYNLQNNSSIHSQMPIMDGPTVSNTSDHGNSPYQRPMPYTSSNSSAAPYQTVVSVGGRPLSAY